MDVYTYLLLFETLGMNAVVDQLLDDACADAYVVLPIELIKGINS